MPDTPQTPPTPTTPAPSSPTPPSGTPTKDSTPELNNLVAPEYRYPETESVPAYLRGKTAGEAAKLLQGLVENIGRGPAQAAPQEQPPAQDDEYVTGGQLRQVQQQALAQVNPWLQTVADQQANMSYNLAKREQTEIFKKYEPEIISVLQRIPRQNWTLDAIQNAVTFVKGNHVDELAAEKVRQLEMTMASTMRSTGRAGLTPESPTQETVGERLGKTPDSWRTHAQAVGITDQQVYEFCHANDTTPEEFFAQFKNGIVTDAVADVNYVRSRA